MCVYDNNNPAAGIADQVVQEGARKDLHLHQLRVQPFGLDDQLEAAAADDARPRGLAAQGGAVQEHAAALLHICMYVCIYIYIYTSNISNISI